MDSELSYNPLPAYSTNTPVQHTSPSNLADGSYQLKLTFAAKINANQPAGHYTTKAIVSVAADAKSTVKLADIAYMQEMAPNVCANSTENDTKQLIDKRDNKKYWVAKLKDGNCWMTQNLDFDIPNTLSSTATDVQEDTEGTTKTVTTDTIKVNTPAEWTGEEPTYNAYYDPGDYYYNGPDNNHSQDTTNSCTSITDGLNNSKCNLFATTVANTNASGNANNHYHVGNYYSFSAATVKSGDSLTSGSAPDSICPKGWQLPTSGTTTVDDNIILVNTSKSFAYLLESYGYTWNKGYYTDTVNGGTSYNIYAIPLYFTYGGSLASGALYVAGNYGDYWSSAIAYSANAFFLDFCSVIYPANSSRRYNGLSVRCVAR